MIHLLLIALLGAAQNVPSDKCLISGTVVDSVTGVRLNRVEITAENDAKRGAVQTPSATSDASGQFTLVDVPPGHYVLKGQRNGYLETSYGARRPEGEGTPVSVEAGQNVKDLQFKLVPFGVIAGTVRDQDGEALSRVSVRAYRVSFQRGRRLLSQADDTDTDDLGQYRIFGLAPGNYYVAAKPDDLFSRTGHRQEVIVPVLYPGVEDPASAHQVEVGPGARLTGIDLALPRRSTVRVSGHATVPAGTKLSGVRLTHANPLSEELGFRESASLSANGDFDFPAVPAGAYFVSAGARLPGKPTNDMAELMFDRMEYRASVPLEVTGVAVKNFQINVQAGAQVTGHISVAGEKKRGADNFIGFDDATGSVSAFVREDQTFSIGLPAGHHYLDHEVGRGYIVQSVQLEGRDIFEEGLTISGPGQIELEIVLSKDGGQLTGLVSDKDGAPVAGATVVLAPESRLRSHQDLFLHSQTDQAGRYEFQAIQPGNYTAFACEDVEPGIWWDADFMRGYEGKGEAVVVKSGGRESLKLTVIPRMESK